ncbi:hypothetical protein TGAM01_v210871 [Trichoderma gamsii]|uniref:Uncharacterized protein n=1 Tax=Trichoderma gamsii TaxID=398673 RepID=A0A2P4Z7M2_9HYPO|nr:hypothetical protein TGAM01_v210871 [Trichoderma gamsii]PON20275.1 hypothetical protein TGAM01_v210871 [Trichoderma gamsii]
MFSSSVLNDSVQLPQMQQKLAGTIENILQIETDTSSNGMDLFTRLRDTIRQRTRDEHSRIESFAIHLNLAADYTAKGLHDLLAESESSSSDESVDTEPESMAGGAATEYNGLVHSERLNDPPSESESPSSAEPIDAEPESTAEGATTEFNMLAYLNESIVNFRQLSDACITQFPTYRYIAKCGIWEPNVQNCGLAVIGHACMRMLDLSIVPGDYDLDMIRIHTVEAFNNAWAMGDLSEAPLRLLKN